MTNIEYSFDKKQKISNDNEISLYKINNFKIDSGSKNNIYMKGEYFPIKYNIHYSHLIQDYIGPFLQLKEKNNNIKMIFFKNKNLFCNYDTTKVCDDLAKEFDAPIIDISEDNYVFETIYLNYRYDTCVNPNSNTNWPIPLILGNIFANIENEIEDENPITEEWLCKSSIALNKYFSKYSFEKNIDNLYISRKSSNQIHKQRINSDIPKTIKHMLSRRIHHEEYDSILEDILIKRGYTIIDPLGMGFYDQIKYYMSAKNIVSIDGGGLINAILKTEECKVFQIKINKNYYYYFDKMIECVYKEKINKIEVFDLSTEDAIAHILKFIP